MADEGDWVATAELRWRKPFTPLVPSPLRIEGEEFPTLEQLWRRPTGEQQWRPVPLVFGAVETTHAPR